MAYSDAQIAEYNAYLEFLKTSEGQGFPVPRNIDDYFSNVQHWMEEWGGGVEVPSAEPTTSEKAAYERYQLYADLYRDSADWRPRDIKDFLDNQSIASEQLDEWQTEAYREYQEYKNLASYRGPQEWYAIDLDDFVTNWQHAQKQQDIWLGLYETEQTEQQALDKYYEEQRAEVYRPEVRYGPAFYERQEALQGESVYYQDWMKKMFPELTKRFEATQPRPRGYATRAEARTAAERTEKEWGTYLDVKKPKLYQEFYSLPFYQRGERPSVYQSRLRQVSYG